jgi:nitroreductase
MSTPPLSVPEAIERRRSVRKYTDAPVSDADLRRIVELAGKAPSAWNIQPWRVIAVRDAEVKAKLQQAAYGQAQVGNAPVLMVLSGNDLTAQEFLEHTRQVTGWQLHMSRPKLQLEHVPKADHTFSAPLPAALLLSKVVTWMNCLADNTPKSTQ